MVKWRQKKEMIKLNLFTLVLVLYIIIFIISNVMCMRIYYDISFKSFSKIAEKIKNIKEKGVSVWIHKLN